MTIATITQRTIEGALRNSPVILTVVGAAGVVSTTLFAFKGGIKAGKALEAEDLRRFRESVNDYAPMTPKEEFLFAWPEFVPGIIMGGFTIAAIVMSHRISSTRYAALAGVYTITERALQKYEEKVREVVGQTKDQKIKDSLAEAQVAENPVSRSSVIITGKGDVLCYDSLTGRYFESNVEALRKAQNDLNARVINNMYASQNEFYALIDLPPAQIGEELGWRDNHLMELSFSSTLAEDGRPCLVVDYYPKPVLGYYKEH